MSPKISFVVPVYDGDCYLAETIESLRSQTLKEIEIIVVDDCSPDYSGDLINWYQAQDKRIKYHRFEHNRGVQEARNYGNQIAESDLICVSDQDDLSMPYRAMYSYHFMNHYKNINCLTSRYWELDVDGQQVKEFFPSSITKEMYDSNEFVWFHSSACYWKKDILRLPYELKEGETDDYTFLGKWLDAGMKFYSTNRVLANCRRVPWGVMQQRRARKGLEPSYYL